jgi:hypothetical protein
MCVTILSSRHEHAHYYYYYCYYVRSDASSEKSGDLPSSKQRNKSKKKENTKKEVQSAQNTHITIREFNKVAHSSKPSSVSTNRTELMPRSVSTNRTLICVKLFCFTGINMFIIITTIII